MNYRRLRGAIELVGVLSVVGGLFLVAFEVRQSNRIARAQTVIQLGSEYNEFNSARFADPDLAILVSKFDNPDTSAITPLDSSRMRAIAYHLHNILWSAQTAHDNGLLSSRELETYRSDLASSLVDWPAMVPHFLAVYEQQVEKQDAYVFQPLANLAAATDVP